MLWFTGAVFDEITDIILLIAEILIALIIVEKVAIAIHNYFVKRREQQVVGQTCQDADSDEILDGNIALHPDDVQVVGVNCQLVAGEYVIWADESVPEPFEIAVNGIVGCYCDGDVICLADGDTVCSSDAIVIKLCND